MTENLPAVALPVAVQRAHAREQDGALGRYLEAIVGREPLTSLLEIRSRRLAGRGMEQVFVPVGELDRAGRAIVSRGQFSDTYVGVAPRTRPEGHVGAVDQVWVLWADIDSERGLERLRSFTPPPSIVVRSGSGGAHAYWPLSEPLSPVHVQRGNRRLALALDGDPKATDGARILRPPQTRNFKHSPAREVVCTRLEPVRFNPSEVVGHLPDTPHYSRPPRRACKPLRRGVAHPERVLDGLARTVAQAKVGNRNASLYWSVCRALEHADAGALDEGAALDTLSMAALDAGLSGDEIKATIGSARRTTRRAA
jgi:hypothetical protein